MKSKPKCSLLATKVGWLVKDAAGRMLTITEIDEYGYRWCDRVGKNRYLQKFTCNGDPLLNAAQNEYAVAVFPPKIPRVKSRSAHYAALQRLKSASKAMRLVAEAMQHLGHADKAEEANGAHLMLKDWVNGVRAELARSVGIELPSTGEAACLPNSAMDGSPSIPAKDGVPSNTDEGGDAAKENE